MATDSSDFAAISIGGCLKLAMTPALADLLAPTPVVILEAIDWQQPPAAPSLQGGEVHVWRLSLAMGESLVERYGAMLSMDEQARAQRLKFDRHRRQFVAARCGLRMLLGAYLDMAPSQIVLSYGPHGKPALAAMPVPLADRLRFNLAHTDDYALYAITCDRPIGIDLERMRPMADRLRIAQRFFTSAEAIAIAQLPASQQTEAFFTFWTLKEAYLKATGEGLARLQTAQILSQSSTFPIFSPTFDGWSLYGFSPMADYLGAITHAGTVATLKFYEFSLEQASERLGERLDEIHPLDAANREH